MYPKVAPLGMLKPVSNSYLHVLLTSVLFVLALDLLEKLLQFDPSRRLTCEEALAHPYFVTGPTVGNPNPTGQYTMREQAQLVSRVQCVLIVFHS